MKTGSIWGSFQGCGSFRDRDHFGAGIISGPGSFRDRDHFGTGIISGPVTLWFKTQPTVSFFTAANITADVTGNNDDALRKKG